MTALPSSTMVMSRRVMPSLSKQALRLSAEAFHAEIEETRGQIAELVRQSNLKNKGGNRARIKE